MFARIRHLATYTENYDREAQFYKEIFGFKKITNGLTDETGRFNPNRGHMSDGVVGVAMVQRHPGAHSGLDHFGLLVEDMDLMVDRLKRFYPETMMCAGLEHVPFAAKRIHDPVGTHIDVSQKGVASVEEEHLQEGWEHLAHAKGSARSFDKMREGYIEDGWEQPRHLDHIALRAMKPERLVEFYQKVFELRPVENFSTSGDLCLTDGSSFLMVRPCNTSSYRTMKQGLDHVGFKVESIEQTKKDLEAIAKAHPQCAPRRIAVGTHGPLVQKDIDSCPLGKYAFADPDGILLDLTE